MDYALFLQLVTKGLEQRLGEDYIVTLRSIPKNNGVTRDGISVCHKHDQVAPTIYLNDFYQEMKNGRPMEDIFDMIYQLYLENPGLPYLDSRVFASYQDVKDRIVYKLVNTGLSPAHALPRYVPGLLSADRTAGTGLCDGTDS